jgi:hypothetical protein
VDARGGGLEIRTGAGLRPRGAATRPPPNFEPKRPNGRSRAIPSECKQVLRIEFSIPSFVGGPSDGPWSRVDTLHFELKTFS